MTQTVQTDTQVKFGIANPKTNKVDLLAFCKDPGGSGLTWFQGADESVELSGYTEITADKLNHSGQCVDTGEYDSRQGEMLKTLVEKAPTGTKLVVAKMTSGCGTSTFAESVSVQYYQ